MTFSNVARCRAHGFEIMVERMSMGRTAAIEENESMHRLFPHFRSLCRLLESHDIPYFLAGGTLLGAVRDGDLIAHDYDFDIDCLMDDLGRILALEKELAAANLAVKPRFFPAEKMVAVDDEVLPGETRSLSSLKVCEAETGKVLGDIYMFTIFRDGIARRHDLESRSYCNAKMSLPAWYYEARVPLTISGEVFSAPRDPELLVEKIYGSDWRTPLKTGDFGGERTKSSGSVLDADRERLVLNALENGWDGDYSAREPWPPAKGFVINKQSVTWAKVHEPMFASPLAKFFTNEAIAGASVQTAFRVGQYMRYFVTRTWYEHSLITGKYRKKIANQKLTIERLNTKVANAESRVRAKTAELEKLKAEQRAIDAKSARSAPELEVRERQLSEGAFRPSATSLADASVGHTGASVWRTLIGKLTRPVSDGTTKGTDDQVQMTRESSLFDADWYLARYPDVALAGADPATHYCRNGAREHRDPGPKFSTRRYLAEHPEIDVAQINPLVHYLLTRQDDRSAASRLEDG